MKGKPHITKTKLFKKKCLIFSIIFYFFEEENQMSKIIKIIWKMHSIEQHIFNFLTISIYLTSFYMCDQQNNTLMLSKSRKYNVN